MGSRRRGSVDREEYVKNKKVKEEDNKREMSLNEMKEKAKNEQRVQRYRHSEDRHRRRGIEGEDVNYKYDERRDRRHRDYNQSYGTSGGHSHTRSPNQSNESKDRNKSEEFWSKESKIKTKTNEEKEVKEKQKPNFETTGKLAEDTNVFNGVVIKYNEPLEARKPKRKWRLYPFKGDESLNFIPIHRQSAYLLGRDRKVADIPIDHPSCSKQHSVIQFRLVEYKRDDQTMGKRIRPYIIDLESSNGSYVNNQRIESKRYYELFEKDVIKFGFSTREYVLLHEQSRDEAEDDDIEVEAEVKVKSEQND